VDYLWIRLGKTGGNSGPELLRRSMGPGGSWGTLRGAIVMAGWWDDDLAGRISRLRGLRTSIVEVR